MRISRTAYLPALVCACAYGQSASISFPSGFIPFSSISYVTAADSAGDHLVVGVPAPGALASITANIQPPALTNQTFCDAQVQLAPQQFYPNVYVPTAAEVGGNFSAFSGLLTIPGTTVPYAGGVIPASQLASVFAWRIGPAHTDSANGSWSPTGSMTYVRAQEAVVLLPSGKVLIVGAAQNYTTELYDPETGAFTLAGTANASLEATATLLRDGRVLIAGTASAQLYDPVSRSVFGAHSDAPNPRLFPYGDAAQRWACPDSGRIRGFRRHA